MDLARHEVIQSLLDLRSSTRYLEIGVHRGLTFNEIRAARKVGVDPNFLFDFDSIAKQTENTTFHQVTSDEYFGSLIQSSEFFDVIFLDGLHIATQTIRDLLNSLAHLAPYGVVIIDDVEPESYEASLADTSAVHDVRAYLAERTKATPAEAWMGDIYKVQFFIQAMLQQYSYATILENHGQTLLWREKRQSSELSNLGIGEIDSLEFKDFVRLRSSLKHARFDNVLEHLTRMRDENVK